MQRADSFEKTLMLGKIEGRRRRGRQRMRWLDGGGWASAAWRGHLPGGLLKTKIAGSGTEPEILYLTNSQVMLMLLGQGPNFENHWAILYNVTAYKAFSHK